MVIATIAVIVISVLTKLDREAAEISGLECFGVKVLCKTHRDQLIVAVHNSIDQPV